MSDRVKPRLSRGFQDLFADQMLARQQMLDRIRGVYELYGFVPLATPAVEYLDILSGSAGTEAQATLFTASNPEDEKLGLRFDLTVPLARVVSQYRDLPRPFRRYQVASVWRADKPGPGRFREFTQFDLDSVGVAPEVADTEIIAGMCDTLEALEVGSYQVRFSSRSLLNLLLTYSDVPAEQATDVFRVLDKLDKIGAAKVRLELTTGYVDKSGDTIRGLGLATDQVDRIDRFLAIQSPQRSEVVAQLRELFAAVDGAAAAIDAVGRISSDLASLGYGDDKVTLDLSIARGLAYYTGPVFEAVLPEAPKFGSVMSGGRYDGLVARFLGEQVPATGASVGVDRLLAALVELGRIQRRRSTSKVLVTRIESDMTTEYLGLTYELRRAGIPAEVYLGKPKSVGKQLKYADQCEIPLAVLYGANERDRGVVTIKDLDLGRRKSDQIETREQWIEERPGQREIPRSEFLATVRAMLAQIDQS